VLLVQRKPLVAVVLTGSEVVTSGERAPGQVRDTFGSQLGTVIAQLGGMPGSQPRIGDSSDEWLSALADPRYGQRADVTITTGGTEKSVIDHFCSAVANRGGKLLLDGIAIRPGRPAVLAELPDGRSSSACRATPLPPGWCNESELISLRFCAGEKDGTQTLDPKQAPLIKTVSLRWSALRAGKPPDVGTSHVVPARTGSVSSLERQ